MRKKLTSLLLVEERLFEAEHFAGRMASADARTFQYELNACLSACRAVTNLVAAELKGRAPGFRAWWKAALEEFEGEEAAGFFVNLRNYSLHQGRIGVVGGAVGTADGFCWTYRFAATQEPVPESLWGRDVTECCLEHVGKLAGLVLRCAETYPNYSCPRNALSSLSELSSMGLELDDLDELIGLPRGWTDVPNTEAEDRLAYLAGRFDGVDFDEIRRIANYRPPENPSRDLLVDRMASRIDARARGGGEPGDPVLTSIFERIAEVEGKLRE
jgi:hypothetical protein